MSGWRFTPFQVSNEPLQADAQSPAESSHLGVFRAGNVVSVVRVSQMNEELVRRSSRVTEKPGEFIGTEMCEPFSDVSLDRVRRSADLTA